MEPALRLGRSHKDKATNPCRQQPKSVVMHPVVRPQEAPAVVPSACLPRPGTQTQKWPCSTILPSWWLIQPKGQGRNRKAWTTGGRRHSGDDAHTSRSQSYTLKASSVFTICKSCGINRTQTDGSEAEPPRQVTGRLGPLHAKQGCQLYSAVRWQHILLILRG